ncbi:leucine-rich repeat domain-containing protein [Paenibacillus sinopodophylli]|uniref:leucine-rich repeat domain-containing protein n=1 Tax=Paenibacillus sinopodophylli TaxID=1837342 RepID=UPI0014865E44|nr:leucine-rich repeat domain-containing protein [Paenibacillus sinopodophylli]
MITTYLRELLALLETRLPQLAESLEAPATPDQIAAAEQHIGVTFSDDLRQLYLAFNGEKRMGVGLFFGLRFLSLNELVAEWQIWSKLNVDYGEEGNHFSIPTGWIKEKYINLGWLPIAEDGGGNHLGIDVDPDDEGISGQVINFGRDEETKYVIANRLADLMRFMCDTVKSGNYKVDNDEEYVYWMYGEQGVGHFLDAVRSFKLPLYHSQEEEHKSHVQLEVWEHSLSEEWRARVESKAASAEAFVKIKQLYLIREGITDATPLSRCTEVRELVLTANAIVDIEPLRGCDQLKVLYLGGNPVSDIKPLASLRHLQFLNIAKTNVEDISPLEELPKLKELQLEGAAVRDFSPLRQMRALRILSVSGVGAEQLRALSQIKQLQELSIEAIEAGAMSELPIIGKLKSLKALHLKDMNLADLQFLSGCVKLEELKLEQVSVADFSAIAQLSSLRSLELQGSEQIGQLLEATSLPNLRKFTGSYAQFNLLKKQFVQKVDFSSITGAMTKEQSELWSQYLRANR